MKPVLFLSVLLTISQAFAIDLGGALFRIETIGSVKLAKAEVTEAQSNYNRQLTDPALTKPTQIQARQRVELAQAKLDAARRAAQVQVVNAYTQALEAAQQVALAQKAVELSEMSVNIAQIRLNNGSGTALDLKDAQRSLQDAQKNANTAKNGYNLSLKNLKNLIGQFEKLDPIAQLPAVPDDSIVETIAGRSVNLLQLKQGLEMAQMQVGLLDPSYASQSQIDAAQLQADNVAQNLEDVMNGEVLQVGSSYDQLTSAYKGIDIAGKAQDNTEEAYNNDVKRLQSGLISKIALKQSELKLVQANLGLLQARNAYVRSFYSLQTGGR